MLKLRVGVLEQHNIVRHGLYKHLSRQSVLCLSEFFNFADMLEALEQEQLDVLMIGHLMDSDPVHLVRNLITRYPGLKILVLLNRPDPVIASQLQAVGAHGVMSKTQSLPDYADALRSLARGERYAMLSDGRASMEKPIYDA
ncbi:DNA-binding response regulator [Pseudomonas protegens]|uniref:DNA-binding response regulator n=1 Tax=Pseudomonas protegens TaxID=380021 RepID=UPI003967B436